MNGTRHFRVTAPDLALLESGVAIMHDCASLSPGYSRPDVQAAIEEVKRILSDVRWDYGPFSHVERIPMEPTNE